MQTFGDRLKAAFGGKKNKEIASILGVSESAVSNYMAGRVPDETKLIEISELTNCNLHWLITGKGDSHFVENNSGIGVSSKMMLAKLRVVAADQARIVFSEAEIGGGNIEGRTLDLLIEFLIARSLRMFNLIEDEREVMTAADYKRMQRFTFVANQPQLLDDRIREMISNAMASETRFTVDTEERFRAIIRELVQEEVSKSRKRPVYPLRVADASTDENLEETTLRKVG